MKKESLKKLHPLVQLVPAAAVVTLVLATLPNSRPVLAAVPERLDAVTEPSSEESQPEVLEVSAELLPYADGVYTGSAQGYGGLITVQVTIESGRITDIQILDASHETASFFNRAKTLVETVLTRQTWEVDTVSGATYSSRGILGAIQNALTGEEIQTETPEKTEPTKLVSESFSAPAAYRDGVYTGSAQGFGGLITVQVTISGGVIADVTVISADGETASYFSQAKSVLSAVVSAGSPNVDTVSGATYSSNGILNAVKRALSQAAADGTESPEEEPSDTTEQPKQDETINPELRPTEQYLDGIYTGTGEGFGGTVTVSVTVTDGRIADIQLISATGETPSFLKDAMTVLTEIKAGQTTEVDTVSGATYSSNGLKEAVRNALELAKEEQPEPTTTPDPEPTPEPEPNPVPIDPTPEPGLPPYLDGTYSATAVCTDEDTFCYDVRVELVVENGVLTTVTVTKENDTSEMPEDNETYLDYAINGRTYRNTWFEGLVNQILKKQSADEVDTVSRATYSSKAIQSAAQQALEQAKQSEEAGE